MRGAIARNMTQGWQAPRVAMGVAVDCSAHARFMQTLPASHRVGLTPWVLQAVAHCLARHPAINALLKPEGLVRSCDVHLGLAVGLDEGLAVPVIHHADQLSLQAMAEQVKTLAQGARQQSLPAKAYQGGTFTVTNLGMTGIRWFSPILNAPQVGILGLGSLVETAVVRQGTVQTAPMMEMTLVFDHRALDGLPAAQFLADVQRHLEQPEAT
jgi:pyruvate dehydrogenase E2 component (dihydrolipoamide acetyltransferase)